MSRRERRVLAGALAALACALAGAGLNLAGADAWAPTWPALLALGLLALAILAQRYRHRLATLALSLPVLLLGIAGALAAAHGRREVWSGQLAHLQDLPANSAAGLAAVALALILGTRRRGGMLTELAVIALAAAAVALGIFGLFGRLLGIAPGLGWGAVSSVSVPTGIGLVLCGISVLLLRTRGVGSDDDAAPSQEGLLPAFLVLAIALGATALAWRLSVDSAAAAQRTRFEHQLQQLGAAVQSRLLGYVDVLRGAQGLFAASVQVDADEWRRYWDRMDLSARYPGIDAMGYAQRVAPEDRTAYEAQLAARIRPDLRIWPIPGDVAFPVTFAEPPSARNMGQVGFDLASEPLRRSALLLALATDEPVLSGRLELGSNGSVQSGFLVFVPLRQGKRDEDPPSRTFGVAYFAFRAQDWMQPTGAEFRDGLHVRLYDGEQEQALHLLYADAPAAGGTARQAAMYSGSQAITVAGRRWTVFAQTTPDFFRANASTLPRWVLLGGLSCSVLLFAIAWLLSGTRARAERAAQRMTGELRRSQQAWQALTDTANDAIVAAGSDGRIRYVNAATERCFGYDAAALLGQELSVLIPERYREAHRQGMAGFLAGGAPRIIGHSVELAGLRRDGTEFPLEISLGHWRSGDEDNFTAIVRDISRRRAAEQVQETQRRELARSNMDLEQFAYVASHDLQEPLRMVASYVQLLARRYKGRLDQDADDFIGYAVDGALRMQRLIDDLLAYSRVVTRADAERDIDAGECLAVALRNLAARIRETSAQIQAGPLPLVHMDPSQLSQLLQNLVGNALKFCADASPQIDIDAQREDAFWHFRVKDNGIGLDPQYAERIFVIFQRLHGRQQYSGTGIGLAICKKIVERAGGRIWVESQPGQGATFHFTLPVVEKPT
ncbi:PAS domain S-box-containing protein [Tahibacter aquaticus]|uniref:histidine kinase n=1 Tax=Tahibacter aquaticus TaxID=520092 RepID=A0A4R6YS36_9GAMM|nr:CHASE domain-containing protein [Tahibacter aquaticus]TDR40803.1 PAS domain S-box-containing protein [Tahibacter aquaticus]